MRWTIVWGCQRQRPGDLTGHVIVCGLQALGLRIVEVLKGSSVPVIVVDDEPDRRLLPILERWGVPYIGEMPRLPEVLATAGLQGARAVVSVGANDLQNLETALVVRNLRPDVRIILQMSNAAVRAAVGGLVASGAALDVAALAAPSLMQACLGAGVLELDLGGEHFAVHETVVAQTGTLRSTYGDLVPIAVVEAAADHHATAAVEICPGRDHAVKPGDRVSVLGTPAELEEALGARAGGHHQSLAAARSADHDAAGCPVGGAGRWPSHRDVAPGAGAFGLVVEPGAAARLQHRPWQPSLVAQLVLLHYRDHLDGRLRGLFLRRPVHRDADIRHHPDHHGGHGHYRALFALITDLLFSRRVAEAFGLHRVTRMRGHVVVIGLGAVGLRVVEELLRYGLQVVVLERDEGNRHLAQARALHIPIVVGDATQVGTLDAANIARASAVAILTSDDLTNLETGLSLQQYVKAAGSDIPIIMRIFDRPLGRVIEDSFGFHLVRSTSALAAPWFVGAALGLDILSTFYVEQELLLVASLTVAPAGGLAGLAMQELSARIRVIAIRRAGTIALEHPPRRTTRFAPGDRAYLIGPYDELLVVLERDSLRPTMAASSNPPGS